MAASTAVHSYGSTLSVSSTSGGSYTALAEVLSMTKKRSVGATKVSHLTSDSRYHEYIPGGFIEPGDCVFKLNFTKTQYNTMLGYIRTLMYWKITTIEGSVTAFAGFWTEEGMDIPEDDRVTCDFTVKCSGVVTFTAGA